MLRESVLFFYSGRLREALVEKKSEVSGNCKNCLAIDRKIDDTFSQVYCIIIKELEHGDLPKISYVEITTILYTNHWRKYPHCFSILVAHVSTILRKLGTWRNLTVA